MRGRFALHTSLSCLLLCVRRPSVVVFGQKDFLQTVIVRKLCAEFFPDVEVSPFSLPPSLPSSIHGSIPSPLSLLQVAVVPTVREKDGLAFASRNARLTPEERKRAPLIYQTLQAVEAQHRRGERDAGVLTEAGRVFAASHGLSVDYITVCDLYTGRAVDLLQPTKSYCVAIGNVQNTRRQTTADGCSLSDVSVFLCQVRRWALHVGLWTTSSLSRRRVTVPSSGSSSRGGWLHGWGRGNRTDRIGLPWRGRCVRREGEDVERLDIFLSLLNCLTVLSVFGFDLSIWHPP